MQDPSLGQNCIGIYNELPIGYLGLEQGIKNTYNKLK